MKERVYAFSVGLVFACGASGLVACASEAESSCYDELDADAEPAVIVGRQAGGFACSDATLSLHGGGEIVRHLPDDAGWSVGSIGWEDGHVVLETEDGWRATGTDARFHLGVLTSFLIDGEPCFISSLKWLPDPCDLDERYQCSVQEAEGYRAAFRIWLLSGRTALVAETPVGGPELLYPGAYLRTSEDEALVVMAGKESHPLLPPAMKVRRGDGQLWVEFRDGDTAPCEQVPSLSERSR